MLPINAGMHRRTSEPFNLGATTWVREGMVEGLDMLLHGSESEFLDFWEGVDEWLIGTREGQWQITSRRTSLIVLGHRFKIGYFFDLHGNSFSDFNVETEPELWNRYIFARKVITTL
jgi:hypothetical protein